MQRTFKLTELNLVKRKPLKQQLSLSQSGNIFGKLSLTIDEFSRDRGVIKLCPRQQSA